MDFSLSSIAGLLRLVFKPLIEFAERVLFYKAYKISTIYKIHREAVEVKPRGLGEELEYDVFWMDYRLGKKLTTPMIWVRAKSRAFKKVSLSVTAFNDKIRYQDCVVLYGINEVPTQAALPSIPFRKLKIKGGMVVMPYEGIKVIVNELITYEDEELGAYYKKDDVFFPHDNLAVPMGREKDHVEKWGEYFNMEFIEMEIKEERVKLLGESVYSRYPMSFIKRRMSEISWISKIIFWKKNLFFAKDLKERFENYLKDYEELEVWKQEKEREEI